MLKKYVVLGARSSRLTDSEVAESPLAVGGVFPERGADVGAVVGAEVLVVGKRGVVLMGDFSARAEDAFAPADPQAAARRPRQASHRSSLNLQVLITSIVSH
jgi:hypothetical protein